MPRFSETEKQNIKSRLLEEGERLFAVYGLKKVTIDELVHATGIAKGSFYVFYPSKEQLFFEIAIAMQERLWQDMEGFLQTHKALPPRELMKQTFIYMLGQYKRYPIMQKMDNETTALLFRKLPKEVVEAHTHDDSEELLKLQKYGIHFTCDIGTAAKIMQVVAVSVFNLAQDDEATRNMVTNTILDGVLKEIVRDEK